MVVTFTLFQVTAFFAFGVLGGLLIGLQWALNYPKSAKTFLEYTANESDT